MLISEREQSIVFLVRQRAGQVVALATVRDPAAVDGMQAQGFAVVTAEEYARFEAQLFARTFARKQELA